MDLNDTIDNEDALFMPSLVNIQPYQFEPMAEMMAFINKFIKLPGI